MSLFGHMVSVCDPDRVVVQWREIMLFGVECVTYSCLPTPPPLLFVLSYDLSSSIFVSICHYRPLWLAPAREINTSQLREDFQAQNCFA